jgi:hypothetical protein
MSETATASKSSGSCSTVRLIVRLTMNVAAFERRLHGVST